MMTRTALITGISGQDGAYLAQFLLKKGYRVVGGLRRSSRSAIPRLIELKIAGDVEIVDFDLAEITNIMRMLKKVQPDEIYNLAAQSFVALSFEQPIYTSDTDGFGPLRILEALREVVPTARFYQAPGFGIEHQRPDIFVGRRRPAPTPVKLMLDNRHIGFGASVRQAYHSSRQKRDPPSFKTIPN